MTNDKKQDAPKSADVPAQNDEVEILIDEDGELLPGPMELLEIEIADLKDRYLRQAADMENLRKRTERERTDIKKYAVSEFARDILPLSDNFQRAIDAVPAGAAAQDEALKSFLDGVKMNERELQKVLERHGVTQLDPKGEKFDPNQHQAVQQIENTELPNNTVVEVFQVGYVIAERVLRPAVVSVAKGGTKAVSTHKEPPFSMPGTDAEPDTQKTDSEDGDELGSNVDKSA
ncbi:MAG: nucleotide exchange factor GrpE [bacterium]|nr:nucleotide exchange factor GrpE [bacterium]